MIKVLIYREDEKVFLINNTLPILDGPKTSLNKTIFASFGFSVSSFGKKYKKILIARRIFGDLKKGSWVGIEEASSFLNVDPKELQKSVEADIQDWNEKQITLIGKVFKSFRLAKIDIFLYGGWAIDFLLGQVSRPHVDIDSLVWKKDKEKVSSLMQDLGFATVDKGKKFQNSIEQLQFDNDFVELVDGKFITGKNGDNPGLEWPENPLDHPVYADLNSVEARIIKPSSFLWFLEWKKNHFSNGGPTSGPREKTERDISILKTFITNL